MPVIDFVVAEILSVPAYLVGIITAIGLIALRKSAGQVIGGALKTILRLPDPGCRRCHPGCPRTAPGLSASQPDHRQSDGGQGRPAGR